MQEEVKAEEVTQELSAQEQESQVLEQAAETGEVTPEAAGVSTADDGTIKIDLDALQQVQGETEESVLRDERVEDTSSENEPPQEETPVLEVVEEQPAPVETETPVQEVVEEEQIEESPKVELPENVDKLVKFMEETGGTLEDYVNLNKDLSKMDPVSTIREYYKQKYPHYDDARIDRKMNKSFLFDQENDDPDAIQEKQDAFQDELHTAQNYLQKKKDEYYSDLKLGSKLTPEAQEAIRFTNEQKQTLEQQQAMKQSFLKETDKVFTNDFKGFDFKVGEKTYRYNVNDSVKVKEFQSDLNNFVGQFLDDNGQIANAKGYHKAMFAAQNVDKIAQHFYEQGRAEAIKNAAKEANNINMDPRQDASSVTTPSGNNVRVVAGNSMDKLRINWKK